MEATTEAETNGINLNAMAYSLHRLIRSMQAKRGFCWATNAQLAGIMHITSDYVSHLLTLLDRAGLVYRHIERDKKTKEVLYRQLYAFKEAEETATKKEVIEQLEADRTEEGQRRRLVHNGLNVGITTPKVLFAIKKYGVEAVENALICVKAASTSCNNPIKYFFAALNKAFKPAARAVKRYFGKAYADAKRHAVKIPAMPDVKEDEIAWQEGSLFKSLKPGVQAAILRRCNAVEAKEG